MLSEELRSIADPERDSYRNTLRMAFCHRTWPNASDEKHQLPPQRGDVHGRHSWAAQNLQPRSKGICSLVALYVSANSLPVALG